MNHPTSTQKQGIYGSSVKAPPPFSGFKIRAIQPVISVLDASPSMWAESRCDEANAGFFELNNILCGAENKNGFLHAVVSFNDTAQVISNFVDPALLKSMSPITPGGSTTRIATGLAAVNQLLDTLVAPVNCELLAPVTFLLSDGGTENEPEVIVQAEKLKARGVTIVTCGYGSDADERLLIQSASSPNHYVKCMSGQQLLDFLAKVGHTLRVTQRAGGNARSALGGNN